MLIGSMSGMPFGTFIAVVLPVVLVVFALHLGLALTFYRKVLPRGPLLDHGTLPRAVAPEKPPRGVPVVAVIFLGVIAAFFAGAHLGYAAMGGAVALITVRFRDPAKTFAKVDWTLLLFFCGLFIVTGALRQTGLVESLWREVAPALRYDTAGGLAAFTGTMTLGSNLVSNVPMVVLTGPYLHELGDPQLGWTLLAYITTIAGNLTLVGSVANIIVAEGAREHYHLGFVEYLRFGAVSTVLALAVGVPLLVWWGPVVLAWLG
jgi:Na+/H+ antiporter NhaD/arsenite permease-like protein